MLAVFPKNTIMDSLVRLNTVHCSSKKNTTRACKYDTVDKIAALVENRLSIRSADGYLSKTRGLPFNKKKQLSISNTK
jgi:hypothetical protein